MPRVRYPCSTLFTPLYSKQTCTLQPFASGVMATGVFLLHLHLFVDSFRQENDFWYTSKPMWPHVSEKWPVDPVVVQTFILWALC